MSKVLGEDHPFTLACAVNKANCLYEDRQLSAAESLLREALEQLQKMLGEKHPDTLICEGNLAVTMQAQGRVE